MDLNSKYYCIRIQPNHIAYPSESISLIASKPFMQVTQKIPQR